MFNKEDGLYYDYNFIKNEIMVEPKDVSRLHDGCGLCPEDKLTARFIVQLLRYGYNDKEIYTFFNNTSLFHIISIILIKSNSFIINL